MPTPMHRDSPRGNMTRASAIRRKGYRQPGEDYRRRCTIISAEALQARGTARSSTARLLIGENEPTAWKTGLSVFGQRDDVV